MTPVRVGVVSDESLFARTLCEIVAAESSFRLIPVDLASAESAAKKPAPCVLLLDSRNPGSLDTCRRVSDQGVAMVIVLGVPDDQSSDVEALLSGARGVLHEGARADEVVKAIRLVHSGGVWASRHVIVAAWRKAARRPPAIPHTIDTARWELLSARERQVLGLAAAGLANKELADRLAISEGTVKTHMARVFRKLGVRSRAELAAAYHGIVAPDGHASAVTIESGRVPSGS